VTDRACPPALVARYLVAKQELILRGYAREIFWQESLELARLTEEGFLREAAWVVLTTGMRERVIRAIFPAVSRAFFEWRSAARIVRDSGTCKDAALRVFGHRGKVDAIIRIAELVEHEGFDVLKDRVARDGTAALQTLPFIGPITSYHLAKNIGLDVVKPDRHLSRLASATGFRSPLDLCKRISGAVGDKVSVVDIVLWRYAATHRDYLDFFGRPKNAGQGATGGPIGVSRRRTAHAVRGSSLA